MNYHFYNSNTVIFELNSNPCFWKVREGQGNIQIEKVGHVKPDFGVFLSKSAFCSYNEFSYVDNPWRDEVSTQNV